jgi:hypothetical protein
MPTLNILIAVTCLVVAVGKRRGYRLAYVQHLEKPNVA